MSVKKEMKIPLNEKVIAPGKARKAIMEPNIHKKTSETNAVPVKRGTVTLSPGMGTVIKKHETSQSRITNLLGVTLNGRDYMKDGDTSFILEKISEKSLPVKSIKILQSEISLSNASFAQVIGVSPSSLARYKGSKNKALPQKVSEPLVKLAEVTAKGEEVFGSAAKFSKWFERPNSQLEGKTPKDLLSTHYGHNRIMSLLGRYEWGLFS